MTAQDEGSPPAGRRASVMLTAALVAVILMSILTAVVVVFRMQDSIYESKRRALNHYRSEIATHDLQKLALSETKAYLPHLTSLYRASNASLAGAQMENDLKQIGEATSGETRSIEILATRKKGDFEIISLQGETSIAQSHLGEFLYRVETHSPNLIFDGVSFAGTAAQSQSANASNPRLAIRWTVHGYRWKESK